MSASNELTGPELIDRLRNRPEAVVARMSYQEQCGLLQRICFGEATVTEPIGAALLEALRLQPHEVSAALAHVEEIRRRNAEGLAAYKRLVEINEAAKEPLAALNAKVIEVFGPEWELIRPIPFYVDWDGDRVELQNAPVLQPLADAVTAVLQGRAAVSRVAQMIEQQLDIHDLLALAGRRRELAADAARRSA